MKKALLTLSLMLVTAAVMAVPAKKGIWKTITLANGTEVRAQLKGDEFGHYWLTTDGKRLVATGGQYQEETPALRQAAAQRRAQAQQRRAARLPRKTNGVRRAPASHLGKKKGLIILVNFKDVKFQEENDLALYKNIANTPGYTDENGFKGSVADYFKDQSREQFELTFDVVGPVTVSKNAEYYGENNANGDDSHPEEMVVEAVKLAKAQVTNWKQYDWDNDGEVDQVMIIYAGEGEADGGAKETIWPHEWELQYVNLDFEIVDGVKINTYAVANEGSVQQDYWTGIEYFAVNGIGTICHEFSHCLGLPDMYDTSYSGNFGMGDWSLMDSGSYNGDGFIPSGYTSYDKYQIGWITPTELTAAQTVSNMRALTDADDVYMIKNAAHPDEYYLLENRQQKGWDAKTPAKGMLILHVDYDPYIWAYNLVNSNSDGSEDSPVNDHQRCTIFHADGVDKTGEILDKLQREGDSMTDDEFDEWVDKYYADVEGDVYPQENNNQLTNTSTPRAFLYNKNSDGRKLMNISITDITQNSDGTISFKFAPDNSGSGEEGDNTEYGQVSGGEEDNPVPPSIEGALFYESFDECDGTGGNDGVWNKINGTQPAIVADNEGWVAGSDKGYAADQCARFGTGDVAGSATTPAFAMNGVGRLTFKAGAWDGSKDGTTLNLSVSIGKITPESVTIKKGEFTELKATIVAVGNVKVTFTAQKGRFFLDEVLVTDPNATAIRTIETAGDKTGRIYTIDGRFVGTSYQQLSRGLYIVNGRKVVIK